MEATDFTAAAQAAVSAADTALSVTASARNASTATSFLSSVNAKNIVLGPFRLLMQVDNAVFNQLPRYIGRTTGLGRISQRAVAAVHGLLGGQGAAVAGAGARAGAGAGTGVVGAIADTGAHAAGQVMVDTADRGWGTLIGEAFQTSTFKSYWGMLHYLMSRWAFTCFFMALVLNRVAVYGAPRQRIMLTWTRRLMLRIVPILLLFSQVKVLMQAIRCQTSPDFALYRHGDLNKYSLLDWSQDGGSMYRLMSALTWWNDDEAACAASRLGRTTPGVRSAFGSFALLWPTFLKLCVSHVVESISCTIQQIQTITEVGMSVFEHSLAFAEAETMITHAIGVSMLASGRNSTASVMRNETVATNQTIPASATILAIADGVNALTGPHVLDRVNVPVEVLLVALLSCGNALTAHVISVLGQQKRLRLLNTAFWGTCFMSTFVWGFFTTSKMVRNDGTSDPKPVSGLLHFPTVAIIGFLPHMAILIGVAVCTVIYLIALILTAVSLGTNRNIRQPSSLSERISIAHDNLQAAIQIKGIKLRWSEDFYTALLRLGFAALTAASEAVFLNEGRSVEMKQFTWLEEDRLDELDVSRGVIMDLPETGNFQIVEEYGLPPAYPGSNDKSGTWQSGYARERKFDKKEGQLQADGTFIYPNPKTDGVGALQRTARFYLLFIFIRGIFFTTGGWVAFGIGALLDRIGITARPNWLKKIIGSSVKKMIDDQKRMRDNSSAKLIEFWYVNDEGKLVAPSRDDVDIEPEMRKRAKWENPNNVDEGLDEKMYDWFKLGGWFGTVDASGDYQPAEDNEDTTSVVSMSTNAMSEPDEENAWESDSDGRRTPTQKSVAQSWSFSGVGRARSATPDTVADNPLDTATLARLLNPQDAKSREEARILASHFASESDNRDGQSRIVTRSQYRKLVESERSRVLLSGRAPIQAVAANTSAQSASTTDKTPRPLTHTEEADILESLLMQRRAQKSREAKPLSPYAPGTEDDEAHRQTGPPCVVCQSQSRTIIAWPCRCLSLCEECRVSLAMNNFGNCVTCRRTVGGFVRLYIP